VAGQGAVSSLLLAAESPGKCAQDLGRHERVSFG
jgi:hypothetical protein